MRTAAFGVALAVSIGIAGSAQGPARDRPGVRSYWLDDLTYRYTIDAPSGPLPPTLLKRPGSPGREGGPRN
jgi:hypothetical protein